MDRPQVLVRLRWAAYRAGFAALSEALDAPMPMASAFRSAAPKPPWGHPDLVLARAVRQSVLTQTEADLIGATRLDETPITNWADRHQMSNEAAYKARQRAERRLVAFLREQTAATDPDDPVSSCLPTIGPRTPSRPTRTRRSPCVTAMRQDRPAEPVGKSPVAVSKSGADSGLLGCGGSTPALAPRVSPEAPRCA
ncbi:hypothetical protein QF026_001343 [Streptomyces aurantiacus]|uniref:hypothetical protein n=1 Tax=Streptomyces aurantiacus TaxID=47760 RepID=UPI0027945B37|nr:hypothetical protein [Streptomyces aurantiacus]MDQ0772877.1 hypothetical protein [Streptomyces aurantiacus]